MTPPPPRFLAVEIPRRPSKPRQECTQSLRALLALLFRRIPCEVVPSPPLWRLTRGTKSKRIFQMPSGARLVERVICILRLPGHSRGSASHCETSKPCTSGNGGFSAWGFLCAELACGRFVLCRWVFLVQTVATNVPSHAFDAQIARCVGERVSAQDPDGQFVRQAMGHGGNTSQFGGNEQV